MTIPGADVTGGYLPVRLYSIPNATGTLVFDSNGQLTVRPVMLPFRSVIPGLTSGASDMSLTWNLYNNSGDGTADPVRAAERGLSQRSERIGSRSGD